LTDSLNMLDTSSYENVLEVKLEWDGSVKPQIHEIIPVKKQSPSVENVNDIKKLVEQLAEDGAFVDEQSVHQLQLHLTAVEHYEKQEDGTKVVKHMNGFKNLLDYQKENELLSEESYETLNDVSDVVSQKWEEKDRISPWLKSMMLFFRVRGFLKMKLNYNKGDEINIEKSFYNFGHIYDVIVKFYKSRFCFNEG